MIDQTTIDRIFDAADIVDVISDFVQLKRRGTNYLGLCPFHNEKTPSFNVSQSKGIYKCFGCGKGGNVVSFIMEHEHMSYPEALKYIANKYGIPVHEETVSEEEIQKKDNRESMMIVNEFARKYFRKQLTESDRGRAIGLSYFRERGFTDQIIDKFDLGYCPEGKDVFTTEALGKGYKIEFLESTGLTIVKDNWQVDRFSGRVMFPIHSVAGRVIGFGGRTLSQEKKIAKYLNSPESDVYHKSKILYGIFQAKRKIVQDDNCYLVEGYTDVISLHKSGIENVVASSGTSLTEDQILFYEHRQNNLNEFDLTEHTSLEKEIRSKIVDIVHRSCDKNLMISTEGVASVRYEKNDFLITPTGYGRRSIDIEDIVMIKDGKREKGKYPSRSVLLHHEIYKQNPNINSIILAQSPSVAAYAISKEFFQTRTIPESYVVLRDIHKIEFGEQFNNPLKIAQTLSKSVHVILIQNDCILTTGKNILEAFDRLEVAEFSANSLITSRDIGECIKINDDQIEDLNVKFMLE